MTVQGIPLLMDFLSELRYELVRDIQVIEDVLVTPLGWIALACLAALSIWSFYSAVFRDEPDVMKGNIGIPGNPAAYDNGFWGMVFYDVDDRRTEETPGSDRVLDYLPRKIRFAVAAVVAAAISLFIAGAWLEFSMRYVRWVHSLMFRYQIEAPVGIHEASESGWHFIAFIIEAFIWIGLYLGPVAVVGLASSYVVVHGVMDRLWPAITGEPKTDA